MDYTYRYEDKVHLDCALVNAWWLKTNPNSGWKPLTEVDMPMTVTGITFKHEFVRVENDHHIFHCPPDFITRVEPRPEDMKLITVMKIQSKLADNWCVATNLRQLTNTLEMLFQEDMSFDEFNPSEVVTITFQQMTQAEIDALPEMESFFS